MQKIKRAGRPVSTLDFGLSLEKRLQTVTFSPAVFRADILASMFDILKQKDDFFQENLRRMSQVIVLLIFVQGLVRL